MKYQPHAESIAELLEPRRLYAAHAFMAGKTLEVIGDPQLQNIIFVEFSDSAKSTIDVTMNVITDPSGKATINPSDFYGTFPAAGVKQVYVRGGLAADTIDVGGWLDSNNQSLGFNIPSKVDTLDGNNLITVGNENIVVNCGAGNDTVTCGSGNDTVRGGAGNDLLSAGNGKDELAGEAGDDWLMVGHGRDILSGGAGNDRLNAEDETGGGDAFFGGAGNDSLYGGNGNDSMWGGAGNDSIAAGSGHDSFGIGIGNDSCYNSAGSAIYYTRDISADATDYDPRYDKIINTISKFEKKDPKI